MTITSDMSNALNIGADAGLKTTNSMRKRVASDGLEDLRQLLEKSNVWGDKQILV